MSEHLAIKELSFSYPDGRKALDNISIKINKGERVAIIGPNGGLDLRNRSAAIIRFCGMPESAETAAACSQPRSESILLRH